MRSFFNKPTFFTACFLIGLISLMPNGAYSWFPLKQGGTEVRFIASSQAGIFEDDWDIEGSLVGGHFLNDSLHLSGLFKLGGGDEKESNLGAMATYKLNRFVFLSASGDVSDERKLGATALIHAEFNMNSFTVMPFIKLDHKKIGEIGLLQYVEVEGVLFSLGIS